MHISRLRTLFCSALLATCLSGCGNSPSLNVLGAFFPSWLFCAAAGIAGVLVVRAVLIKRNLVSELGPLLIIYPAIALFFTMLTWIVFFKN